jgi:ElaB/YqjD/DUF883 family membrane-anchored ribosome-binding protein
MRETVAYMPALRAGPAKTQGGNMSENLTVTREKLLDDFNKVVDDTEELLKSVATVGGDKATALRARMEQNLQATKERLSNLQKSALETTTAAAKATDTYVHDNPWQAVGVAAGVGFLIGLLLSRR